jgi:hypothetical protein
LWNCNHKDRILIKVVNIDISGYTGGFHVGGGSGGDSRGE